jgi:hypothetical protein
MIKTTVRMNQGSACRHAQGTGRSGMAQQSNSPLGSWSRASRSSVEPWYGRIRSYRAARSLEEVIQAWSGVYASYRRSGLIPRHPLCVYLLRQAVDPSVLVVVDAGLTRRGRLEDGAHRPTQGLATLTAIPDVGQGIPLDEIYGQEIDELRRMRRAPIECVLMTDDRQDDRRSMTAVFALMSWVFFYGIYLGKTDLVFGVHPRHVAFYRRMLGAVELGPERTCPRVQDAPVVGLRLDLLNAVTAPRKARAIEHFLKHPLARDEFADRFQLSWSSIQGSVIEEYLGVKTDGPWAFRRRTPSGLPSPARLASRRRLVPSRRAHRRKSDDAPGKTSPARTDHPGSE